MLTYLQPECRADPRRGIAAALAAYGSVRFLSRYFTTRTLLPFAARCLIAGALAMVCFA